MIQGTGGGALYITYGDASFSSTYYTHADAATIASTGAKDLYLNAGAAETMVIKAGGNVGIGTTSPGSPLHVGKWGAGGVGATIEVNAYSSNQQFLRLVAGPASNPNLNDWSLKLTEITNGDFSVYDNARNASRLLINAAGNVGIGTTSPGNILSVVQNSATDPIADAWTTYSSIRWKEHIVPFSGALDKIKRLRTVYFDWKSTKQRDLGMIAEEVGAVIPEAVAYEANGQDAKSIDYGRLTAVLVQAIKELKAENDTLKVRLEALEKQRKEAM